MKKEYDIPAIVIFVKCSYCGVVRKLDFFEDGDFGEGYYCYACGRFFPRIPEVKEQRR